MTHHPEREETAMSEAQDAGNVTEREVQWRKVSLVDHEDHARFVRELRLSRIAARARQQADRNAFFREMLDRIRARQQEPK